MTRTKVTEVLTSSHSEPTDPAGKLASAQSKLKAIQTAAETLPTRIITATEANDLDTVNELLARKRGLSTEFMLAELQVHLARLGVIESQAAQLDTTRLETAARLDAAHKVEAEATAARMKLQNDRAGYSSQQLDIAQQKGAERAAIERLQAAIAAQR
jgi:hypothetical protein